MIYINIHQRTKDMIQNYQQTRTYKGPDTGPVWSISGISVLQWMPPGRERFHQDILQSGLKIKIWWGDPDLVRSGH